MIIHSFSTLGCPELDLYGVMALAARHGFHTVELRALSGRLDLPALFKEQFGTPEKLAQFLRSRHIRACALDTSFKLIGATDADRAELLEYVHWADGADVMWLRVIDGGETGDAQEMAELVATLEWWREQRLKNFWAVDVMVETRGALVKNETLSAFLEKNPQVALLWDTHNTWRLGQEDPVSTWKVVRNHTVHIHVKDSVNQPTGEHPFTYVIPGDGEFPMRPLLDALNGDRFKGVMSLEWERHWHPYLPELSTALHAAARRRWW